jgi:hypothetical protein
VDGTSEQYALGKGDPKMSMIGEFKEFAVKVINRLWRLGERAVGGHVKPDLEKT